jgi:hypothetical protein
MRVDRAKRNPEATKATMKRYLLKKKTFASK